MSGGRDGSTFFTLRIDEEFFNYLDASARLRKTSRKRVINEVFRAIMRDQMITAILDDDAKKSKVTARLGRCGRNAIPETDLFDGLRKFHAKAEEERARSPLPRQGSLATAE